LERIGLFILPGLKFFEKDGTGRDWNRVERTGEGWRGSERSGGEWREEDRNGEARKAVERIGLFIKPGTR